MVEVIFTEEDRQLAIAEAHRRQQYNEQRGVRGRELAPERGDKAQRLHYYGAAGELAVASYLGLKHRLYETQTPVRGSSDLPMGIDVKTRSRHHYDLLLFKDYEIDKTYVLVTIENRRIFIHGYIQGNQVRDVATPIEYVSQRHGLAVRQKDLKNIDGLKRYAETAFWEFF